ncbi:hypothetical protein ACM6Q7_08925 [Peribacillus butanolivorans]
MTATVTAIVIVTAIVTAIIIIIIITTVAVEEGIVAISSVSVAVSAAVFNRNYGGCHNVC